MSNTIALRYEGSVLPSVFGMPCTTASTTAVPAALRLRSAAFAGVGSAAALVAVDAWLSDPTARMEHTAKQLSTQIDVNVQGNRPRGPEPV